MAAWLSSWGLNRPSKHNAEKNNHFLSGNKFTFSATDLLQDKSLNPIGLRDTLLL